MGVYVYTRRNDVREVNTIKIVRFAFAYKPSRGYDDIGRTAKRLLTLGEIAAECTRGVNYAITGEWKNARIEKVPVFLIKDGVDAIYDDVRKDVVGYLRYEGRKLTFTPDLTNPHWCA